MNSFISALFGELSLALVFLFMCSPIALLPLFYLLQYLSYFPRFYLGRMRLAAKLESVAKTYDLEFYRHRPCFYYGKIGQTDCEFSLVTPRARYAVKLIGLPNRHLNLTLTDYGTYYTQKPALMRFQKVDAKPPAAHVLAPHRFFVSDERVRTDDVTPVWLINPCPRTLYFRGKHSNDRREPYDGENLCGITLFTLTGFLRQIERDCRPGEDAAHN